MSSQKTEWPPELDALVAAPEHHRLRLQNDRVRVLETIIKPGERVPLHTHEWPCVNTFLSCSDCVRRDQEGNVLMDTRTLDQKVKEGDILWLDPLEPHTLENVGEADIHVISVEVIQTGVSHGS